MENVKNTSFSTPENFTDISRKSSIAIEESSKEKPNKNRCSLERRFPWRVFKIIVFLICLTCLVLQAMEFYHTYKQYPTNIVLESRWIEDFVLPAITFCYRNSISAEKFCLDYPDLCQKPNNLEEFCRLHPKLCLGNTSELVIPKHGYFTNDSKEVEETVQHLLLNGSESPPPFTSYYVDGFSRKPTITFVPTKFGEFAICYSINLHLDQCSPEPIAVTPDFHVSSISFLAGFNFNIGELESFYPWENRSFYFDIHAPSVPRNPVLDGQVITSGLGYLVTLKVEKEERLLPPPYQTNCRDYTALEKKTCDASKITNPSSYQMCLEMCRSEYFIECTGCIFGLIMHPSKKYLCHHIADLEKCENAPEREDELKEKRRKCEQDCKQECRKRTYSFTVTKYRKQDLPVDKTFLLYLNTIETPIIFFVEHSEFTLLKHAPLYGNGELFSYVGGLIGCWLGISFWTFTDIIEKAFRKVIGLKIKRKLRMKRLFSMKV